MNDDSPTPTAIVFGLAGLALHLVLGFLVLVSGLVAPPWAVGVMAVGWLVALLYGLRAWQGRISIAVGVPVASWLAWVGLIVFGDVVLGWTA